MYKVLVLLSILTVCIISALAGRNNYQSSYPRRGDHRKSQRRDNGEEDRIIFPESTQSAPEVLETRMFLPSLQNTTRNELPLDLAFRLSELGDINAFMEELIENKEQFHRDKDITDTDGPPSISLSSRFGTGTKSTKGGLAINCMPIPTVVRVAPESHPLDVLYFPECSYVNRCSGCCPNPLLSCQPTEIRNISVKVFENRLTKKNKLRYAKSFDVELEEHVRCSCKCRIQAHHCQSTQRYDSNSCRCICNIDGQHGRQECENSGKVWDESTCTCDCPGHINQSCTLDANFNTELCACTYGK